MIFRNSRSLFRGNKTFMKFGQYSLRDDDIPDKERVSWSLPHVKWTQEQVKQVDLQHKPEKTIGDKFANIFIQSMRHGFDIFSGYKKIFPFQNDLMTEQRWLNRVVFLETIAGVPGFVAGMHRHLRSLRTMKRDNGWIHTLLEEAENERIHLFTFLQIKNPGLIFRAGVVVTQLWYVAMFSALYQFFPRVSHRVVGYLEEEAVKTYTFMIEEIKREGSPIHHWSKLPASEHSIEYWGLKPDATLLDVVYSIRKDEEHHKDINHMFADDYTQSKKNPLLPGE